MSYNIMNPLFPRPASNASGFIASQVTTVTTGVTTVTAFNTTPPYAVDLVAFDVSGGPVRVLWEGSTPTSTSGHTLTAGSAYTWAAVQYNNSKFIRDTSATADAIVTASPFTAG
jgi:hypothetical protein